MPDDIEQIDATLCEDGCTVSLMGHTADDDVTYTASVSLPMEISDEAFLHVEWSGLGNVVQWCRHG